MQHVVRTYRIPFRVQEGFSVYCSSAFVASLPWKSWLSVSLRYLPFTSYPSLLSVSSFCGRPLLISLPLHSGFSESAPFGVPFCVSPFRLTLFFQLDRISRTDSGRLPSREGIQHVWYNCYIIPWRLIPSSSLQVFLSLRMARLIVL